MNGLCSEKKLKRPLTDFHFLTCLEIRLAHRSFYALLAGRLLFPRTKPPRDAPSVLLTPVNQSTQSWELKLQSQTHVRKAQFLNVGMRSLELGME